MQHKHFIYIHCKNVFIIISYDPVLFILWYFDNSVFFSWSLSSWASPHTRLVTVVWAFFLALFWFMSLFSYACVYVWMHFRLMFCLLVLWCKDLKAHSTSLLNFYSPTWPFHQKSFVIFIFQFGQKWLSSQIFIDSSKSNVYNRKIFLPENLRRFIQIWTFWC